MTNTDFWTDILRIIDEGFTAEGLAKLDYYADKFITQQLVYQRFSPFEQHGCSEGGAANVVASLLAGADAQSDQFFATERSFKEEQQRAETQAAILELWARKAGCWFDDVDTELAHVLGEQLTEGGEAHVFYHGSTLVKYIGLDYFILPILALDRVSLHNAYFPETKMTVLGFGKTSNGEFQIIVEQPFIQGFGASDTEIKQYAESLGFELVNPRNWTFANSNVYLSDLHDENVIKSASGRLFVIDCDIRINVPQLRSGGNRVYSFVVQEK